MTYKYHVYILTNVTNSVLYVGVTGNLSRRIYEHKNGLLEGFTKKYNVKKLVYAEVYSDIKAALFREKQIKGWTRQRKIELINSVNPTWDELSLL